MKESVWSYQQSLSLGQQGCRVSDQREAQAFILVFRVEMKMGAARDKEKENDAFYLISPYFFHSSKCFSSMSKFVQWGFHADTVVSKWLEKDWIGEPAV